MRWCKEGAVAAGGGGADGEAPLRRLWWRGAGVGCGKGGVCGRLASAAEASSLQPLRRACRDWGTWPAQVGSIGVRGVLYTCHAMPERSLTDIPRLLIRVSLPRTPASPAW